MNIEARYLKHAFSRLVRGDLSWLAHAALKRLAIPLGKSLGRPLCGPIIGGLLLNYRCNLKCVYCSYWKVTSAEGEMDTARALAMVDQFHDIGTSGIGVMGGEPLLRRDVYQILQRIVDRKMTASITTNGYPVNDQNASALLDTGVDFISVSLDSVKEDVNDYQRGKQGACVHAIKAMKLLVEKKSSGNYKTNIMMNVVVTPHNFRDVPKMVGMARDIGLDNIYIIGADPAPAHSDQNEVDVGTISDDEFCAVMDFLIKERMQSSFINASLGQLYLMRNYQKEQIPFPYDCLAGYTSIYVDTYGHVFPCNAFLERKRYVDAVTETRTLRDVWESKKYSDIRASLLSCKECYWPCQHEINQMFSPLKSS